MQEAFEAQCAESMRQHAYDAAEWSDLLDDAGEEAEREMMAEELRQARVHAAEEVEPHVTLNLEGDVFAADHLLGGELYGLAEADPEDEPDI